MRSLVLGQVGSGESEPSLERRVGFGDVGELAEGDAGERATEERGESTDEGRGCEWGESGGG